MNNMQEIVTKAVISKFKKEKNEELHVKLNNNIDNVLGCWVINHTFNGVVNNNQIIINGLYDINIWYSYDNNSKTNVMIKNFEYNIPIDMNYKKIDLSNSEVVVKCLTQPSVIDAQIKNDEIILSVNSTMGIELFKDTTIKVNVSNINDDYEDVVDTSIDTDYLK